MSSPVRHGFFLLEAAVAVLAIGLVAGAALELFATELRAAAREPQLLTAVTLAQDRLAAIRLLEPIQLARIPDSLSRGRFTAPYAGYRWRTYVTRSVEDDLYDVRVEIAWSNDSTNLVSRIYAPFSAERAQ